MPLLMESTKVTSWKQRVGMAGTRSRGSRRRGDAAEGTEVETDDRRNTFKRLQLTTIFSFKIRKREVSILIKLYATEGNVDELC